MPISLILALIELIIKLPEIIKVVREIIAKIRGLNLGKRAKANVQLAGIVAKHLKPSLVATDPTAELMAFCQTLG